ncbi:MAG: serine/threonine protein kinase [Myxococcaceae bacterium]|nr:MAG: serine/threonine protein kinase [Myxococcaceae bacterium]
MLSVLGTGGMAEVYRARDTRLGREVALKVVNDALAGDPELVRRFEQEARLAGSLNHPNLVAVHDLGLYEGAPYFITELLQGESLRHRLSRGRIPLQLTLEWGAQLAHGLAAAHTRGIVHRDVKPDNVFVTSDGHVKLLDFGIAKLAEAARDKGPHGLMDVTVTPTGGATRTGSVLGTPGYMSPEQVRGESVDARTDIFSLGAVVYEMVSGKRAFPGATVVESGSAILRDEPEPLPAEVPPVVAQVVLHCLEKEPARRPQSATDLAFELELLRNPTASTGPVPRPSRVLPRPAVWLIGGVAAVLAALLVGLAVGHQRGPGAQPVPEIEQVTFRLGTIGSARFLPDGRVAFSAAFENRPEEVFVQPSGSISPQALGLPDVSLLGVSRTGELAILLHPRNSINYARRGTLARVPSVGGVPRELLENTEYADWSPAGELAVVRVSGATGASRTLESPPGKVLFQTSGWISHPRFSFRGDRIAFLHHPVFFDDMGEVVVIDLEGQTRTLSRRWPTTRGVAWAPDDSEVWFAGGRWPRNLLLAVSLGGKTREMYRGFSNLRLEDVSRDGQVLLGHELERQELVYAGDGASSQTLLSWSDLNGVTALSGDGKKVLFLVQGAAPTGQALQPSFAMLRTTDGAAAQMLGEGIPQDLSPDGRWALVMSTDRTRLTALPTGAGQPRQIATHGLEIAGAGWMPDGKGLLVGGRTPPESDFRLYRLADDGSKPVRVSDAPLVESGGCISQDGRWVALRDVNRQPIIVSLRDGATVSVLSGHADALPRGCAPDGSLWLSQGGDHAPARLRRFRVDVRTGKVVEERSVGPTDPSGVTSIGRLVLTPDGRHVAFTYSRSVGYLHIARGLVRPAGNESRP